MTQFRFLVTISRWIWQLFAAVILLVAVMVVLGRMAIVNLPEYQAEIRSQLTEQLGYPVTFENLAGEWQGLSPSLHLDNFRIYLSETDLEPVIEVRKLLAEPDLLASLYHRRLVWRTLEVKEIAFDLLEDAEGKWSIGLQMDATAGNGLDAAEALLFKSRYIRANTITASFRFFSGDESTLQLRGVEVENSEDFHRLNASIFVQESAPKSAQEAVQVGKESAQLTVEGWGSPLDWGDFEGKIYLKLHQVQNTGLLNSALNRWLPAHFQHLGQLHTDINSEVWVALDGRGQGMANGYIEAAEIPLNWFREVEPITDFSAQITGHYLQDVGWSFGLKEIDFSWDGLPIEPLSMTFRQQSGFSWGEGSLAINQLDLTVLRQMLEQIGGLPDKALEVITGLNPKGKVSPLYLDLKISDSLQPNFKVRGNLIGVAIDAVKKAPASRNINGYFEVQGLPVLKGFLELDSPQGFAMWYPTIYDDYMVHGSARGRLDWQLDQQKKALVINSGPLDLVGEDGVGRGYLNLFLPLKREDGTPQMTLQVGLKNTQAKYRNNYLPKVLLPNLRAWLDSAVGDAVIPEAGFIWRGSLRKADVAKRSMQLYLSIKDGALKFQPDWPVITGLNGMVTVDGRVVEGSISDAMILQAALRKVDYAVIPSTPAMPIHIEVAAQASASVSDAMAILFQSPLQKKVAALADWQMAGDSEIELALTIPLKKGFQPDIDVAVSITDGALADAQQVVSVDRVKTLLTYQSGKGLAAKKIEGYLWNDSPITGRLQTDSDGLLLSMDSVVAIPQLARQLQLPLEKILSGRTAVSANLRIPQDSGEQPRLAITTQLEGIAIDLPEPLAKPAGSQLDSEINIVFSETAWRYDGHFGEKVAASFVVQGKQLDSGFIGVGQTHPLGESEHNYLLQGGLPQFHLADWQAVLARFDGEGKGGQPSGFLSPNIELDIEQFFIEDFQLSGVSLSGQRQDSGNWAFQFESDVADGSVLLPAASEAPIELDLSRLWLNNSKEESSDEDSVDTGPVGNDPEGNNSADGVLAELNPRQLPYMDIQIEKLVWGERELGSLSFLMQSTEQGTTFSHLKGNIGLIELGGSEQINSELRWLVNGEKHRTEFSGLLRSGDLSEVFEFWDFPEIMDSRSSRIINQVYWLGRPDQFSLKTLQGEVTLGVNQGSFYASPAAPADAAIRVVGLFNFANWLRRLRFDFSDIFKKGMSYDELSGGLHFDEGVMTFSPSLEVKMPSGRMLLSGSANLNSEEIDASLAMTIPVATNLPWIVALAGGLPAAAGVYITSKVFESEVDKLSSFSYSIKGPWAEPDISVEKIFSDKPSK